MIRSLILSVLCLLVLGLACVYAADDPTPSAERKDAVASLVRTTINRVLYVLKSKEIPGESKRERVMKIIDPVVDFSLMAKLSLGKKQWKKTSAEQRKTFQELYAQSLKDSYFEKVHLFKQQQVEFSEPVANKRKFSVLTTIIGREEQLTVAYKLYEKKGVWKVYDFEIEGVSIVRSYAKQYRDFLREGNFYDLLVTMRGKVEAIKKREAEATAEPAETEKSGEGEKPEEAEKAEEPANEGEEKGSSEDSEGSAA